MSIVQGPISDRQARAMITALITAIAEELGEIFGVMQTDAVDTGEFRAIMLEANIRRETERARDRLLTATKTAYERSLPGGQP